MNPGARLALLVGCVLVAALVCPSTARVAVEDVLGPYAERVDGGSPTAAVATVCFVTTTDSEEESGDARGDADPEATHEAP